LVDGDLRNPGLTRALAARPKAGLIEVLLNKDASKDELPLLYDHDRNLSVLPVVLQRRVSHTSDLLTSPRMGRVLDQLKSYGNDYIVVDLPPTGPVVDAKAFAQRLDAIVFVVEWGRTSRRLVRSTLENTPVFREKCLGVILNKSDDRKLKFYREYGSDEYYSASRYKAYYRS
jgi:polysaccharide biosynthesis transport protein